MQRRVGLGALAFALSVVTLLVGFAWSSVGERLPQSALARALPGGVGLSASVHRLAHPPPLNSAAPAGERLLDRYMQGRDRVPILVAPDLGVEILVRSGRTDAFNLADPFEDSFVPDERLPAVLDGVRALHRGELMLMDRGSIAAYRTIRRNRAGRQLANVTGSGGLAYLQAVALKRISRRFRLLPVQRSAGFLVVRLAPRR